LLQNCDILVGFQIHRNVERRLEMGEDKLAAFAAYDMLLPEITFFGRESAIVIGRQNFRIGTKLYLAFGRHSSERVCASVRRRGGTQMVGERFFKVSVAIVRRHGLLLS
jgi:hypothetical protein